LIDKQYLSMIRIESLCKSFGPQKAVDRLSLYIKKGEFYGLLGPNGAGKTTTVHLISGLMDADSGNIWIKGREMKSGSRQLRSLLGLVPQEIALYNEMTAKENLMFWGSLYGMSGKELAKSRDHMLKLSGLTAQADKKLSTFSGGMKRRINIVASLLHQPEILIMDEPTVGIDPQSRLFIYEMLQELVAAGLTIIYTTHYMDEVEKLCSRIGIIDHGKLIAEGNINELRNKCGCQQSILFTLNRQPEEELCRQIDALGWNCTAGFKTLSIQASNTQKLIPEVLDTLQKTNYQTESIEFEQAGLERVFLTLTGKKLKE